jgi:hypothetical protein
MGTVTVTAASERATELRNKVNGLARRRGETEQALLRERVYQKDVTARRTALTAELPDADEATQGYLHSEIDVADNALKLSIRTADGLQETLSKLGNEFAALDTELKEAENLVQQQKRSQALIDLETEIIKQRRIAEEALDAARAALFALNCTAVQGSKECGEQGRYLVTLVVEEFKHQQHNPDALLGWRDYGFEVFEDLRFTVKPMVRE